MSWFKKKKEDKTAEVIKLNINQSAIVLDNDGKLQIYIPRSKVEDVDTLTNSEQIIIALGGLLKNPAFCSGCIDQMVENMRKQMSTIFKDSDIID